MKAEAIVDVDTGSGHGGWCGHHGRWIAFWTGLRHTLSACARFLLRVAQLASVNAPLLVVSRTNMLLQRMSWLMIEVVVF